MPLNTALMFSKASNEWSTPQDTFDALDAEFQFAVDCAATAENAKCARWLGPGGSSPDALTVAWGECGTVCWLNPPYSRVRAFISKAAAEGAWCSCTVVALVPARTDTRWWHQHVWDSARHSMRFGVELRFFTGRLKFGGMHSGAPFPSVVVIFWPNRG
jgi:phage N-6-adenine-methyltransferase